MTVYTPTTEEVRYKYSWWTDKNLVARGVEPTDTKAEFDRWLAEHDRQVSERVWEEGLEAKFKLLDGEDSISLTNPYRISVSNKTYDQIRKALDDA